MKFKAIFLGLIGFLFVACSSSGLSTQYYSTVIPDYNFDTNAPTILVTDPWDISSRFYAKVALTALKKRGFSNIYLEGQIPTPYARNILYIKVSKQRLMPNQNIEYTFNATGVCKIIDGRRYCNITNNKNDLKNNTSNISDLYNFTLDWYDAYTQNLALYAVGSVFSKPGEAMDFKVYSKLIEQTVARINFQRPLEYRYKILLF
ncbi:hypothetical protein BKH43_07220 [Helicobacter sp. 13S00401-1]|uniref:hypothetical protein n=1 Tax=Helicobacter sp. 13S00401-1 TaxID=1905758 RepID=UPI000BA5A33A|nr:hypothetical protein [Helicobacter sp. 13S00401-1]PAF49031.1 hypothetical protein BKH43_07220 [Helicobacter sp. 13S00401-1]